MRKQWKQWQIIFLGSKIMADGGCSHEIKRRLLLGRIAMTNLHIKKQSHYLADKSPSSQSYGFSSSHVWMWESDSVQLKNWYFWTVVLEKTLESPLDCKIKSVNPRGNQTWIFFGRTDAEAEIPILWSPDVKNDSLEKTLCWERLKAGREGDDRRWNGWMASPTQWTGVWASSGSWWWTGKLGLLQSVGLQRVGQDWATELNWTSLSQRGSRVLWATPRAWAVVFVRWTILIAWKTSDLF